MFQFWNILDLLESRVKIWLHQQIITSSVILDPSPFPTHPPSNSRQTPTMQPFPSHGLRISQLAAILGPTSTYEWVSTCLRTPQHSITSCLWASPGTRMPLTVQPAAPEPTPAHQQLASSTQGTAPPLRGLCIQALVGEQDSPCLVAWSKEKNFIKTRKPRTGVLLS